MTSSDDTKPVLINLDDSETATAPTPADVPAVPDAGFAPSGQAVQAMTAFAARKPSRLARWFWQLLGALILFFASLWAWNTVTTLIASNAVLGWAALGLLGAFAMVCLALILRELAALTRLRRVEALQSEANRILAEDDIEGARAFVTKISGFYKSRSDTAWGRDRLTERSADVFDAKTGLAMVEDAVIAPLDQLAAREVEAAARQVATITALVPLAFADVLTALTANIRMIRRIAEIYGGRAGSLGAWRLTRAVAAHLVATGAVAVGDDLLGSVGGGHLLGKLSRRFGEGLVNGALTARVGVAAIEVCRPLPFVEAERPRVSGLVSKALTGLFER